MTFVIAVAPPTGESVPLVSEVSKHLSDILAPNLAKTFMVPR